MSMLRRMWRSLDWRGRATVSDPDDLLTIRADDVRAVMREGRVDGRGPTDAQIDAFADRFDGEVIRFSAVVAYLAEKKAAAEVASTEDASTVTVHPDGFEVDIA